MLTSHCTIKRPNDRIIANLINYPSDLKLCFSPELIVYCFLHFQLDPFVYDHISLPFSHLAKRDMMLGVQSVTYVFFRDKAHCEGLINDTN